MARKKKPEHTEIDSIRHGDKRVNIPTEELRDFVEEEEREPGTMLYPRDPSLDPQLVWQGKDEQDAEPLEVPIVPVYIQEKIHPHAIIEDIRANGRQEPTEDQPALFDDFNGLEFEQMIDFYEHEQNWSNRMILGDSLQVMTSLAEKEGLKGQVQMIYIDPPYGIDFGSNWQVSTRRRQVTDGKAEHVTRQPEQIRAFRDTWQNAIHSYLSYLRDRLEVARELLTDTGSVFLQIGDENEHLARSVLDEVFGADNFVSIIVYVKTTGLAQRFLPGTHDEIVWYAKDKERLKYRQLYVDKDFQSLASYTHVELPDGTGRRLTKSEREGREAPPPGARVFAPSNTTSSGNPSVAFTYGARTFTTPANRGWKTHLEGMARLFRAGRIEVTGNTLNYKRYIDDFPIQQLTDLWDDIPMGLGFGEKIFVVQTHTLAVQRCLLMTTDPGDLALDPTCGSGTTAYVAEQWGRRWITIDTSRVALALARTRIMSASYPYYLLADSPKGVEKRAEILGEDPPHVVPQTGNDIKQGFVYKRVPHITLRDIANNEEIDVIYERWQEQMEPLRSELNELLGESD